MSVKGYLRGGCAVVACATICVNPAIGQTSETANQVENTARTTYRSGTRADTIESNPVTIRVDELIDVSVAATSTDQIVLGNKAVAIPFSVTNNGSGSEAFVLDVVSDAKQNGLSTVVEQIIVDRNKNAAFEADIDQVLQPGGVTPALTPSETINVLVVTNLPPTAVDRAGGQVRLLARAVTGVGRNGSVLARLGDGEADAIFGQSGGQSAAQTGVTASLATVSLTKTAKISDRYNLGKAFVGSTITYRIVASVKGSGIAEDVNILDAIPKGTSYVPGSLTLDGKSLSDGADNDSGFASDQGIAVRLGDRKGGDTHSVTFTVQVQ